MPIDYSRYPPNWKSEIVPRILARAGDCCEWCGIANKSQAWSVPLKVHDNGRYKTRRFWITSESDRIRMSSFVLGEDIKRVTVVLTIAHLDHDEENHEVADDRLAALCQPCHIRYDASEKQRRIVAKAQQAGLL